MNSKVTLNVTKWLSILCLLVVLAGGVLPCMTLTGNYQEILGGLTEMSASIPEDQYAGLEDALAQFGCTVDVKNTMDEISGLLDPFNDGEISVLDFYTISQKANAVAQELSGITPIDITELAEILTDMEIPEGAELPPEMCEQLQPIVNMVDMLIQLRTMVSMFSKVALVPVGLFGLLALAVIVRIVLRLFNRRGLGVLISLLTILNAALMMVVPYALDMYTAESLTMGVENTMIPIVMIICSILSCILWGIGRKHVSVKTKTAPVATSVEETPVVEGIANEEASVEETPQVEAEVKTEE